jgi:beta-xylosidase
LRSRSVYGPYEDRIVLRQGSTDINGPHQGAWVETPGGESWFVHFQDRGAYGRVTHLQPMVWRDDWPVIGNDPDGDGSGEPVAGAPKPDHSTTPSIESLQTSDEFASTDLGLQWQWEANPLPGWYSLSAHPGWLRLSAVPPPQGSTNLWSVPNLLLQKLPAPEFTATARLDARRLRPGDQAGLVVMGLDYAYVAVRREERRLRIVHVIRNAADRGSPEKVSAAGDVSGNNIYLRVTVTPDALCRFAFSLDGRKFTSVGPHFTARPGTWVGAKVGVFSLASGATNSPGFADLDWFRFE